MRNGATLELKATHARTKRSLGFLVHHHERNVQSVKRIYAKK
ncbi:hypothetical protein CGMCC3_g11300 [Colletotrichum fructicola]|nr:uncharacterized protein CGMCC3_g11300 [Colletotrichum fructicola]KAE9572716.1 hypothetical protein CGMCC3_g11300 [Colletotrichum fructicola]